MSCFRLPLSLCRLLDKHIDRFWWGAEDDHSKVHWISWRNMCRSKHEGGMGFRRFEQFNQALLAKVGWRILNEPQSLLAQVYKGKYFPNGSFLQATGRSRPSWGWQSILYGRQLLEAGVRWQIGNGESASLLQSSWIPQLHPIPPRYNPLILPDGGEPRVAEVIVPGEGRWCDVKLRQWFDPLTCREIKRIPLPRQDKMDKLIWHGTADGVFTVKSAYHLAVTLDRQKGRWRDSASWMDKKSWIKLWDADIPPKLKVFMWQIFNRVLPTTEALVEKQIPVHPRCPVCWAEKETMEHLFLYCPVARALWDLSGLEHLGQGLPRQTLPLFLKKLMALLAQPSDFMAVVAVLWRIWRSRNWVVFEGKQVGFPALMRQFHQQFEEWVSLPKDPCTSPPNPHSAPDPPGNGSSLVCLWDGATRKGSHAAGGMVLLGVGWEILWAHGFQFPGVDAPAVAELLCLRESMRWCLAHGLTTVCFEGDALVLIDKIQRGSTADSQVGAILEEVVHLFDSCAGFGVLFVGRSSNMAAHLVARKALSLYPTMSRLF
ncbi:unnamed protein product [Linum trigynum]|uniref:Reverse transcriptase zinc-binding domain-containing protein n=1 Tax=Linum trigynum TaxID=586398 RepID=A0AAV2GJ95_9ROSI